MNRKKKVNSILRKRLKKAKAKLAPKGKSSYISKADREAMALAEQSASPELNEPETPSENTSPSQDKSVCSQNPYDKS